MSEAPVPNPPSGESPSPALFFDTLNAYQKSAALLSALDLDVFGAVGAAGEEGASSSFLAERCAASERGVSILADYLVLLGFLLKTEEGRYRLTLDSELFLVPDSPSFLGGTVEFLSNAAIRQPFDHLTEAVRRGGTTTEAKGTMAPEHPVWVPFARAMVPLMKGPAEAVAALIELDPARPAKVLDVAASHGIYGISLAQRHDLVELFALDWAPVLEVAEENAAAAGLRERFRTLEGSAFEVDLGTDYDVVLVPNFLHHFSAEHGIEFLRRVHDALAPGGRVVIVEFVPNEDRVSPPDVAAFSLTMLATTPEGRAHTFADYEEMLHRSGFTRPERYPLPPSMHTAVIGWKAD